jgi:hypothetical protein
MNRDLQRTLKTYENELLEPSYTRHVQGNIKQLHVFQMRRNVR